MEDAGRYLERLQAAGVSLRRVHDALLDPGGDIWEQCTPELDGTVTVLAEIERQLQTDLRLSLELRAEVRRQIVGLRRELGRVNRLMAAVAGSYLGWAEILAAAVNGYSPAGTVTPLPVPTRLSLQA